MGAKMATAFFWSEKPVKDAKLAREVKILVARKCPRIKNEDERTSLPSQILGPQEKSMAARSSLGV
jgi:hypothetical protein